MAIYIYNWHHSWVEFMDEKADPRTANWPLMGSPVSLLIIVASYLYFVCKCGPEYMREKKPYNLKFVITVYNIGQVIACAYIFHGILTSGWLDDYSLGCETVNYSLDPKPYKLAKMIWWTMILKLSEFIETVFFVLRKKQSQVSSLHLYHHVSTLFIGWLCCKYEAGGMASFSIMLNCLVHIMMYSYYLLALHGGKSIQNRIVRWKRILTIIQMLQFWIMVIHSLQALKPSCKVNKFVFGAFIPNVILVFYLFYDFYRKTYKKINKKD